MSYDIGDIVAGMFLIVKPHRMHSIDAAYCDNCHTQCGLCDWGCVCLSVFGTHVICAKTDEPIEMPFGGWLICPRDHVLEGSRSDKSIRHHDWWQDGDAEFRRCSLTSYFYIMHIKSKMFLCLSVLCSLCTATVLSGSARNLACGIFIPYRWSWACHSSLRARALRTRGIWG